MPFSSFLCGLLLLSLGFNFLQNLELNTSTQPVSCGCPTLHLICLHLMHKRDIYSSIQVGHVSKYYISLHAKLGPRLAIPCWKMFRDHLAHFRSCCREKRWWKERRNGDITWNGVSKLKPCISLRYYKGRRNSQEDRHWHQHHRIIGALSLQMLFCLQPIYHGTSYPFNYITLEYLCTAYGLTAEEEIQGMRNPDRETLFRRRQWHGK